MENDNKTMILFATHIGSTPMILTRQNAYAIHFPDGLDRVVNDNNGIRHREHLLTDGIFLHVNYHHLNYDYYFRGCELNDRLIDVGRQSCVNRKINKKDIHHIQDDIVTVNDEDVDSVRIAQQICELAQENLDAVLRSAFKSGKPVCASDAGRLLKDAGVESEVVAEAIPADQSLWKYAQQQLEFISSMIF